MNKIETQVKCPTCDLQLKSKKNLASHIKTHALKIKCDYCETMLTLSYMRVHIKKFHEQGELHNCNHCGKNFRFKSNMDSHINTIHLKNQLACELCGNSYKTKRQLKDHISTSEFDGSLWIPGQKNKHSAMLLLKKIRELEADNITLQTKYDDQLAETLTHITDLMNNKKDNSAIMEFLEILKAKTENIEKIITKPLVVVQASVQNSTEGSTTTFYSQDTNK